MTTLGMMRSTESQDPASSGITPFVVACFSTADSASGFGSFVPGLTSSTPNMAPLPRTSPTTSNFSAQSPTRASRSLSTRCASASSPSRSMSSKTASAAAVETGLPPKVPPIPPG